MNASTIDNLTQHRVSDKGVVQRVLVQNTRAVRLCWRPELVTCIAQDVEQPRYVNIWFGGGEDEHFMIYGRAEDVARRLEDAMAVEA